MDQWLKTSEWNHEQMIHLSSNMSSKIQKTDHSEQILNTVIGYEATCAVLSDAALATPKKSVNRNGDDVILSALSHSG